MDQTILDSSDPYLFERPNTPEAHVILKQKIRDALNWNVVNILRRAARLRPSGKVSAIFLLTNNSSRILVSAVDEVLFEETGNSRGKFRILRDDGDEMPDKHYFFDYIMMRQHHTRPKTVDNNPPKRVVDILNMMQYMGINGSINSVKDIYFFDDIGTHNLRAEFNFLSDGKYKDHYIQINPPYKRYSYDRTSYLPVLYALSALDSGDATLPELPIIQPRTYVSRPMTVRRTMGPLPSAPPPPLNLTVSGRPRSNTKVNADNLELPPPPQEHSVRVKATTKRPTLLGAFAPLNATKGGYKKSRRRRQLQRKRTRRATKKNH